MLTDNAAQHQCDRKQQIWGGIMIQKRIFGLFVLLALFGLLFISCAVKSTSFKSSSTFNGKKVSLEGKLTKPEGEGPYPYNAT